MLDAKVVEELHARLLADGSAKITDGTGRRLFLIHTRLLKEPYDGVVVAYEGQGAFVFELDRPVNKFRLISNGFEMGAAEIVSDLINRMTAMGVAPVLSASPRRLKGIAHIKTGQKE